MDAMEPESVDLDALERLSAEATPGPWREWGEDDHDRPLIKHSEGGAMFSIAMVNSWDRRSENRAYIVALVNAAPELIRLARQKNREYSDAATSPIKGDRGDRHG